MHVRSYAGLWLLLASLAPVTSGPARMALERALELSADDAAAAAAELLAEDRDDLDAAIAGWLRPGVTLTGTLPVRLDDLPDQAGLDRWARDSTHGLVTTFPLAPTPLTVLVLVSVLTARTPWVEPLEADEDDRLVVDDGLLAVVDTVAAGRVAVAVPLARRDLDVVSVIADPDVSSERVWAAVEEVTGWVVDGSLLERRIPAVDLGRTGHAWDVVRRTEAATFDGATEVWTAALPAWAQESTVDLAEAPGVEAVTSSVLELIEREPRWATCVQGAAARYTASGFAAAAVTVMAYMAGSLPPPPRKRRRVTLHFDRPHAVVALARGGAWEGVPVVHAWVDGQTDVGI